MSAWFTRTTWSPFFIKLGSIYDRKKWLLDDKGAEFLCTAYNNRFSSTAMMRVSDESNCGSSASSVGGVELFSAVAMVVKSLNRRVFAGFAKAVERYDFDRSFAAYRMLVGVFAAAQLEEEVFALIADIVSYYQKNAGLDSFNITSQLLPPKGDDATKIAVADALVKVFAAASLDDNAVDVFRKSKKLGIDLDIGCCNFLLECLAGNNKREALLAAVFEEMNRSRLCDGYTYAILIKFYCREGRSEEALRLLHMMMMTTTSPPNVATFGLVISGLCKERRSERALEVIPWMMKRAGISPDVVMYTCLVDGFSKQGDLRKSLQLFTKMMESGVGPDAVALGTLIDVLCRGGMVEVAGLVFQSMPPLFKDEHAYNSIIRGSFEVGRLDIISDLLKDVPFPIDTDSSTYRILIRGFQTLGYRDVSQELEELLEKKS